MQLKDLRVGYVVKTRDNSLYYITSYNNGNLIMINSEYSWAYVNTKTYSSDLICISDILSSNNREFDIVAVYDTPKDAKNALSISIETRQLLWSRDST